MMLDNIETMNKLNQIMLNAMQQLQQLVTHERSQQDDFLSVMKTFLVGFLSTAIDLVEINVPGSTPLLYADIEAATKMGGLRAIAQWTSAHGTSQYSVSGIDKDDMTTAMNYLGQQISITLFKGLHELPLPLRTPEMLLRSVEVLLANLLNQKFNQYDTHNILDSFCDHVHMALTDLETRKKQ